MWNPLWETFMRLAMLPPRSWIRGENRGWLGLPCPPILVHLWPHAQSFRTKQMHRLSQSLLWSIAATIPPVKRLVIHIADKQQNPSMSEGHLHYIKPARVRTEVIHNHKGVTIGEILQRWNLHKSTVCGLPMGLVLPVKSYKAEGYKEANDLKQAVGAIQLTIEMEEFADQYIEWAHEVAPKSSDDFDSNEE